jgi:hypothetical protein
MVSAMASSDVDNGLDSWSGQAKYDEPGISCCSAKYAVEEVRTKIYCYNVSEWSVVIMCQSGVLL